MVTLCGRNHSKEVVAMVDCGTSNTFLNRHFIEIIQVRTRTLTDPIDVYNVDGSINKAGQIKEVAMLTMDIDGHSEKVAFPVTDIGKEDVIIGLDWLRKHNPDVNWEDGSLRLSCCPDSCKPEKLSSRNTDDAMGDTGVWPMAHSRHRRTKKVLQPGQVLSPVSGEDLSQCRSGTDNSTGAPNDMEASHRTSGTRTGILHCSITIEEIDDEDSIYHRSPNVTNELEE